MSANRRFLRKSIHFTTGLDEVGASETAAEETEAETLGTGEDACDDELEDVCDDELEDVCDNEPEEALWTDVEETCDTEDVEEDREEGENAAPTRYRIGSCSNAKSRGACSMETDLRVGPRSFAIDAGEVQPATVVRVA